MVAPTDLTYWYWFTELIMRRLSLIILFSCFKRRKFLPLNFFFLQKFNTICRPWRNYTTFVYPAPQFFLIFFIPSLWTQITKYISDTTIRKKKKTITHINYWKRYNSVLLKDPWIAVIYLRLKKKKKKPTWGEVKGFGPQFMVKNNTSI